MTSSWVTTHPMLVFIPPNESLQPKGEHKASKGSSLHAYMTSLFDSRISLQDTRMRVLTSKISSIPPR
jgi:hypothetical protein